MTSTESRRNRMMLGYASALGAAASYGSLTIVGRMLVTEHDASPVVVTAVSMVFGLVIMTVMFHRHAAADVSEAPRRAWLWVALAGVCGTWGVSFWYLALSQAPVVLVAPIAGTHPLVSILAAHLFLQRLEKVTLRTAAGALMVVAGVALIAVGRG